MRKISIRNYLIYSFICIITIAISLYIVLLNKQSREYYMNNSVLSDVLLEIVPEKTFDAEQNMGNYLMENSNLIIYMSSGKNTYIKDFELDFKNFIISKNLKSDIMYINFDKLKGTKFIEDFKSSYVPEQITFENNKTCKIFIFKDKMVVDIYESASPIIYEIKIFLIKNGVITND